MTTIIRKADLTYPAVKPLSVDYFHYWLNRKGQDEKQSLWASRSIPKGGNGRTAFSPLFEQLNAYETIGDDILVYDIMHDGGDGWRMFLYEYQVKSTESFVPFMTKDSHRYTIIMVIDDDVDAVQFKLTIG